MTAMKATLAWAAALGVLALVFLAYLQPDMMFSLANFVWSCF
jgi:hypothetical protein